MWEATFAVFKLDYICPRLKRQADFLEVCTALPNPSHEQIQRSVFISINNRCVEREIRNSWFETKRNAGYCEWVSTLPQTTKIRSTLHFPYIRDGNVTSIRLNRGWNRERENFLTIYSRRAIIIIIVITHSVGKLFQQGCGNIPKNQNFTTESTEQWSRFKATFQFSGRRVYSDLLFCFYTKTSYVIADS